MGWAFCPTGFANKSLITAIPISGFQGRLTDTTNHFIVRHSRRLLMKVSYLGRPDTQNRILQYYNYIVVRFKTEFHIFFLEFITPTGVFFWNHRFLFSKKFLIKFISINHYPVNVYYILLHCKVLVELLKLD
jgi:hypothetical protein